MDEHYYSINDLLRKEFEQQVINLSEEIYGDDLAYDPEKEYNTDDVIEVINADDDLEELYYSLNQYVNGNLVQNVMYNRDEETSILCKLMIMSEYYEYCTVYTNELDDVNRQIYIRLDSELTISNAINLYNRYHRDILEMYDFILSVYINSPEVKDKIKIQMLQKNLVNNLLKINPFEIFSYRFLLGIKFNNEHIRSVRVGNSLCLIASSILKKQEIDEIKSVNELQKLLELDEEIAYFVDENKSYMISNIYERFNNKNKPKYAKEFIEYLECCERDKILESIKLEDKTLSRLLFIFYLLNVNGLDEKTVYKFRKKIKSKKQKQLIKKYNPFYLEEKMYFENGGK